LRTLLIIMCLAISFIPIGIIGGIQGFQSSSFILIALITIVTFVASLIISYLISRPIERLTRYIDEISKGRLDVNLENSEIYEINNLTDSLNRVMTSLKLAIHKVGVKKGEIFEKTVQAKEAVEEKYTNLLDSLAGWFWEVDDKGIYTYCSKNISNILGFKPDEIIGKSFFDFMLPEDAKKFKHIFKETAQKEIPIKDIENWNLSKNGNKVCMITNGVPFFNNNGNILGYRGVDIDITNRKMAEEKIKKLNIEIVELRKEIDQLLNERNKKKIKKLDKVSRKKKKIGDKWIEHEQDSVFIFDENANILDCNENMYKRLGYTKSEMLSLNMADFDILESKEDISNKIKDAKKIGSLNFKTIHKRKDGSAILVFENVQYIKDENNFKCIVREDY